MLPAEDFYLPNTRHVWEMADYVFNFNPFKPRKLSFIHWFIGWYIPQVSIESGMCLVY